MVRALALALVALALLPASAFAHATLQATVPERGAKLDTPPGQVEFRFDEAVEASFGALRVFDSKGQEVQTGKAFHPGGKGAEIAVKLKPGLGDGTYTATYRVVSADGHAVSSGFVFTVGEAAAPAESLDQLLAGGGTGPITNTALAIARGFQYAAIALGLGALIFFLAVWRRRVLARLHRPAGADPARRRDRRLPLGLRRARAAGRRRGGRDVLGGGATGHGARGARHALRPRLGPRRAGVAARPALALARCAARSPAPRRLAAARCGGRAGAQHRRARRPRRTARGSPRARASPSPSSRSSCCPRSAVTRACSRRWRSCCPRTSSTCSR